MFNSVKKQIHLVVGMGQIGTSLKNVLSKKYEVYGIDKGEDVLRAVDVLHICIPAIPQFEKVVKGYIKQYNPQLTIVHSTVKPGTCDRLGVTHSFIRGVHPDLEGGIKTFVKYFGGKNAKKASNIFSKLGIKTKVVKDAKTTESMKIWSTTQYGWNIILEKEIYKWCKKNKVDFDMVYTEANTTYNEGYEKLGLNQFKRYVLKHYPGSIGGHCVWENSYFLKTNFIGKIIYDKSKRYRD